jgi:hypothetical protein
MPTNKEPSLGDHEKRIQELEKKVKLGEKQLTDLIKEWNRLLKQLKDAERRNRY